MLQESSIMHFNIVESKRGNVKADILKAWGLVQCVFAWIRTGSQFPSLSMIASSISLRWGQNNIFKDFILTSVKDGASNRLKRNTERIIYCRLGRKIQPCHVNLALNQISENVGHLIVLYQSTRKEWALRYHIRFVSCVFFRYKTVLYLLI